LRGAQSEVSAATEQILVIEVDITHASLPKLPIFAQFGVAEVWRYDGERFDIQLLEGGQYVSHVRSRALAIVTADSLSLLLLRKAKQKESAESTGCAGSARGRRRCSSDAPAYPAGSP
jgi:hypothetical protein